MAKKYKLLPKNKKTASFWDKFKKLNWNINFSFNIEKILFARILATLLQSKINIADSLTILQEQFVGRFQSVVKKIKIDVESGISLAEALKKHPKYFNEVYVGLVNVGEKSGRLVEALKRVAEQQEKDLELSRKVQSASLYPAIVILCLLGLATLLSYYILPQLVVVFNSFYMSMPWTTALLMQTAEFIRDYGLILLILLITFFAVIWFLIKKTGFRPYWQALIMSLPFIGELIKKINLARFNRILGTLLKSGVNINLALEITIDSMPNEVYRQNLKKVKQEVLSGLSLGESLEKFYKLDIFPKLVSQMISVGERTGTLEDNLLYLADFYEKEVDSVTKNISNVIEPILLLLVGFVVAFIAVAIISPIYDFVATLSSSI